ncbi:related to nuclear VCP-like protein [Cephalotrichum gorgonifer]|uniref:Related to nuclear VCP-like protein n=1 Tax=Cephalotrichum gorgonifer TaxID=2041049 RepID=A0AAE8MZB0_9PEZI|nr:related to nuclear VCP-like protein [Cephalotrichum gorgonifer]
MPRVSLRQGLDRDVYQIVRKVEDEQELARDGEAGPFRLPTVTQVYDYVRNSNSSLGRLKRRPLEDAIERALKFRKQDLQDEEEESEVEPATTPARPVGESSLMNRQLARRWKLAEKKDKESEKEDRPDSNELSDKMNGSKKRRLSRSPSAPGNRTTDGDHNPTESQAKPLAPKKARVNKGYSISDPSPDMRPLGGIGGITADFETLWPRMARLQDEDVKMDDRHLQINLATILLSGPMGCGKSSLLKYLAARWKVPFITVDCDIIAGSDRMEKSLSELYDDAVAVAPCIVQLKGLHDLWPTQGSSQIQQGNAGSHVKNLLHRLSSLRHPKGPIAVAATTTHLEAIPSSFFMHGLLTTTYTIKPPNEATRLEILQAMGDGHGYTDIDFLPIARSTHGYVADDLCLVFDDGVRRAEAEDRPPVLEDFEKAARQRTPHLFRVGFSEVPDVTLDQVGGLKNVIELLKLNIINRIKYPENYKAVKKYAGVLLWGPPGCGKTYVAQAIANSAQASFILINGPELLDKYVGESERKIRALFARARASAPCLIFLDEIDSLVPRRENSSTDAGTRVVNTILAELDGARDRAGVYVIAATNRPDMIDPAMFRTGRFNHKVFVDVPGEEERVDILRTILRSRDLLIDPSIADAVARDPRCNNFSGADLSELSDRAVMACIGETIAEVEAGRATMGGDMKPTKAHWEAALSALKPSVKDLARYRALAVAEELGVE